MEENPAAAAKQKHSYDCHTLSVLVIQFGCLFQLLIRLTLVGREAENHIYKESCEHGEEELYMLTITILQAA